MAILDGIVCRLQRAVGDGAPVNTITTTPFTSYSSGTVSGIEQGGELAWRFQGPGAFASVIPTIVADNETPSIIVCRCIVTEIGAGFDTIAGFGLDSNAGVTAFLKLTGAGRSNTQMVYENQGTQALGVDPRTVVVTYVIKANLVAGNDTNEAWLSTGALTDPPDFTGPAYTGSARTYDTLQIGDPSIAAYDITILDLVAYDANNTLTDAELRSLAVDIRSVLPVSGGGSVPVGTVTIGSVTPTTTTATVQFTYTDGDETGFKYRLDGGSAVDTGTDDPIVITGLADGTNYDVEVLPYNATGDGVTWSTAFNFTTDAITLPSITTEPLKNNTGQLLISASGIIADVYNTTNGAHVIRKTGLTSDGTTAVVTFTDAAMSATTEYRVVIELSGGEEGIARITTA